MYNRYMTNSFDDFFHQTDQPPVNADYVPVEEEKSLEEGENITAAPAKGGLVSSLLEHIPKLDMDTILLILVVFFLLSDGSDRSEQNTGIMGMLGQNSDLLLIIGLLFILGY